MRPDPLAEAAARRHELTRAKAIQALRELDRAGAPVTFASVAAAAGISRSWLYTQPDISDQVRRLRGVTRERDPASVVPAGQRGEQRQRHREIHHHVRRSFPSDRRAPLPAAATTSSTASRGTDDASTPSEIQSVRRLPAATPLCVMTSDHGCWAARP